MQEMSESSMAGRRAEGPVGWMLAFFLSLIVHGAIGVCTYTLLSGAHARLIPVFRGGESGISVSLVTGEEGDPAPATERAPPPVIPNAVERAEARPPPETASLTVSASDSPVDPPDAGMVVAGTREGPASPVGARGTPLPTGDALPKGVRSPFVGLDEIRPHYPLGARIRGEEGVVTVKVVVNAHGRAEKTEVTQSSRFPALDRAALDAVREARFVEEGGAQPQGGEAVLSFRFRLVN